MHDSRLYTRKQLIGDVWPFGETKFNVNMKAGAIPTGRIINGIRIFSGEERLAIRQAVLEGRVVKVRHDSDESQAVSNP